MYQFREEIYVVNIEPHTPCIIGADIGGTNANVGVFDITNIQNPILLFSLHGKSKTITDFTEFAKEVMGAIHAKLVFPKTACFAVAGAPNDDNTRCKPTNATFVVDTNEIVKNTDLQCSYLVNDFQVIGYGLPLLKQEDIVQVNKGIPRAQDNKVILGAGTGLGKSIMRWEKDRNLYIPVSSEGGHADISIQSRLELELLEFIHEQERKVCNISWEDVLSGKGIGRIFKFFCVKENQEALNNDGPHPDKIFEARNDNVCSKKTFELFTQFYARCAKNLALDALALGGVYIAGGIAAKNIELFKLPAFMQEFVNCGKQEKLLSSVPIYVITDYNVSLYGAAEYMKLEGLCTV